MKINYADNEEFYSLPFYVDPRVLIPRNDTEILVDQVIKTSKHFSHKETVFIDIGTGSSAILTAVVKNIQDDFKQAIWLDISPEALEVANINVVKNNIQNKVQLFQSDLLEIIFSSSFSLQSAQNLLITANLPYIKNGDIANMDQEVLDNEPHIALFWWEKTGFEMYERLIGQIFELKNKNIYKKNIVLFIEIWFDQYEYSRQYLSELWLSFEYFKDLQGIWRCIKILF